jgi:hypothetical protein
MTPSHPARASAITIDQVLAEIEREAQSRARAYPAMIAEARLTAEAAALEQRLCQARAADARRYRDWAATPPLRPHQPQARVLGFTAIASRASPANWTAAPGSIPSGSPPARSIPPPPPADRPHHRSGRYL